MNWYVAHALMILRPQQPIDQPLYCWENLLLISCADGSDPWKIAEKRAAQDATQEFELAPPYSVLSRWEFAGIRKVVEVCHHRSDDELRSGDELSYNTLQFSNETEIQRFVAGHKCEVIHVDDVGSDYGQDGKYRV